MFAAAMSADIVKIPMATRVFMYDSRHAHTSKTCKWLYVACSNIWIYWRLCLTECLQSVAVHSIGRISMTQAFYYDQWAFQNNCKQWTWKIKIKWAYLSTDQGFKLHATGDTSLAICFDFSVGLIVHWKKDSVNGCFNGYYVVYPDLPKTSRKSLKAANRTIHCFSHC